MQVGHAAYASRPLVLRPAVLEAVLAAAAEVDGAPVTSRQVLAKRVCAFACTTRAFGVLARQVATLGPDHLGRRLVMVGSRFGGRRRGEVARWVVSSA